MFGEKMRNKRIKFLLLIFSILAGSILFAQTKIPVKNDSIKFKFTQTFLSISPLISPRISIGIVNPIKQNDDRYLESIFYFHAFDTFSTFKCYGVAFRGNAFIKESKRSGLFLLANGGIDYLQYETFCFDPGGSNCDEKEEIKSGFFPNITFGLGYSFKINNDSFFRLELDFGLKWFLSNIYISYVW